MGRPSFMEVFGLCYMFLLLQEGVWSVNKHTSPSNDVQNLKVLDGKNHTGGYPLKLTEELINLFAQDIKNQSAEPADSTGVNSSLQKPLKLNVSASDTELKNVSITDGSITEGGGPIKLRNDNSKDVDFRENISDLSSDKHIKTNPLNLVNDSFSNSDHDKGNLSLVDHTGSVHPKIIPRKGVQEPVVQESKPAVSREGVETSKLQNDNSHSDILADKHNNNQLNSFNDSFPNTDHSKKSPSVVPRKGVDYTSTKIVPRKGVELNTEGINSSISQESGETTEKTDSFLNKECNCCTNMSSNMTFRNDSRYSNNCTCCNTDMNNENYLHNVNNITRLMNHSLYDLSKGEKVKKQENINKNTSTVVNPDVKPQLNSSSGTVPIRKNKKPQFTLDTVNDSPANSSVKQMSSNKKDSNRTDYVVPVVGIILVIPLLIVLIVFLYKRGSEFWERRHYRRMDFLIDGMYND